MSSDEHFELEQLLSWQAPGAGEQIALRHLRRRQAQL